MAASRTCRSGRPTPRAADIAPLADRLALLQVTRLAMAAVVMVAALSAPHRFDAPIVVVDALAVGFAFVTTAVVARASRRHNPAGRTLVGLLLGDEDKGKRWLTRPNAALGGATPLNMLESSYGAERVRQALSVIEHGGVA